jgi:L-aspartate oxidase
VFGRRAAFAAAAEPAPAPAGSGGDSPPAPKPPPIEGTREALWRDAGLIRDAEGLERLRQDPHPLAPLIAAGALARRETRGCHLRSDFPRQDDALDGRHFVLHPPDPEPVAEQWK